MKSTDLVPIKTDNWKIVHARTFYNSDMLGDMNKNFAQITMTYSSDKKPDNYIVFERRVSNRLTFYSWRIFILNYEYYE